MAISMGKILFIISQLILKSKFRLMCEGEYINVSVIVLGSPTRTFKVSIYMRGIVDFSTYMEYIEYYSSNINDLH